MKKGSITIYISLVFVSVLLLISIVIESARINVVQTECKSFTYLAADSVLAGYVRQVYEDYGILLVWEDKSLKEQLMKYIQANINLADLNIGGTNFMTTRLSGVSIEKKEEISANGGEVFINQVSSYMKYAVVTESVNKLINLYSSNSNQKEYDTTEYMTNEPEEKSSQISEIVKEIHDEIGNLKEEDIKEKLKTERKRTRFLKNINDIMNKIDVYREERKEFLKENTGLSDSDYMDSNFEILEHIKNKIEEEELNVSGNSKENWVNIGEEIEQQINNLTVNTPTREDEKNKNIYENAKELFEKSVLSMVIQDTSNISSSAIADSNLPSKKESNKKDSIDNMSDKAKLIMYGGLKFGNYHAVKKKSALSYELEYIIAGKDNDRSNLTATIEQMVGIRNVAAIGYLITDQEKLTQLSAIASSATAVIGLPFLEPVIKGILMEAWALAEAVNDVKIIMAGEKIDILKKRGNWKTSLQNLSSEKVSGSQKKSAVNYEQFCYLLMMKQDIHIIALRMLDLIQVNIKKNYHGSFDIHQCICGFQITARYETEPLFAAMPWVVHQMGQKMGAYEFSVECKDRY